MKALKAFRGITENFKNKNLIFFPLCLELVLGRAKINPFVEILANLNLKCFKGRVAWWLATCARKPKVPGSSPAASYVQR